MPVKVAAVRDGERLVLDLRAPAPRPADLVDVEDRVGALGGSLAVNAAANGQTHVRVELPCA